MSAPAPVDDVRLALMLSELRLPTIERMWADFAACFLAAMAEHELAERHRRRIERHLTEVPLPPGRTLDSFDFDAVPMISKAKAMLVAAGVAWLKISASCCSDHRAAARGISRRRSAWPSSKAAGGSCSPGPPTSCKSSRWRGANSYSRRPSTASTDSIS